MSASEQPSMEELRRELRQARALLAEHRPREALVLASKVVAFWPGHEPGWRLKAAAHGALSEWWSAEEAARRCVALAPDSARSHANLGIALRKQGRAQEAEEALRRALAIDPGYQKAQEELNKAKETPRDRSLDWAVTTPSATRIDLADTGVREAFASEEEAARAAEPEAAPTAAAPSAGPPSLPEAEAAETPPEEVEAAELPPAAPQPSTNPLMIGLVVAVMLLSAAVVFMVILLAGRWPG